MQYKVVPFHPTVLDIGGASQAASELQKIIDEHASGGWNFVALESMTTIVKPTGCAKFGGKDAVVSIQLIVFKK